jgi:hypothetical protein
MTTLKMLRERQARLDVLASVATSEEGYFGVGGSRRGTQVEDVLRVTYLQTRLSLLEVVVMDEDGVEVSLLRGDDYQVHVTRGCCG